MPSNTRIGKRKHGEIRELESPTPEDVSSSIYGLVALAEQLVTAKWAFGNCSLSGERRRSRDASASLQEDPSHATNIHSIPPSSKTFRNKSTRTLSPLERRNRRNRLTRSSKAIKGDQSRFTREWSSIDRR